MTEMQQYLPTSKDDLLETMHLYKQDGWRLCQISATAKDGYDLLYSLEKGNDLVHVRVNLAEGQWVHSVSSVFTYSYLYENEIKDLFGIDVRGMNVDFQGQLYRTTTKTPFSTKASGEEGNSNG